MVETNPPQPPPQTNPPPVVPKSPGAHFYGRPQGRTGAMLGTEEGCARGARRMHSSIFMECSPSFCPTEQPRQNHTQCPNFCTLQPLLAY